MVIVLVLFVGCRQQCLPPRLCCSSVGVAFLSSSVKCSPPSSYPVGRQRCLPPCPLCPPPAVFCPCPVSGVLASRLVGVGLGQVGPSPCLSAFVLPLLPYLLACYLFAGRRPHHHFCLRQKPPDGRRPLGCLFASLPCWLIGWGSFYVWCRLYTARLRGRRTIIYISYPHLSGVLWGYVSPNPPTKYNINIKGLTAFNVHIAFIYNARLYKKPNKCICS